MNLSEQILAKMQVIIDKYFEESNRIKEDYEAKCRAPGRTSSILVYR